MIKFKFKTVEKEVKVTPDVRLKDGNIILSQSVFDNNNVQSNKLQLNFDEENRDFYFIFHNEDNFEVDAFNGKKTVVKNEDGSNRTDENGQLIYSTAKKSLSFKDKTFSTGLSFQEMLTKLNLENETEFKLEVIPNTYEGYNIKAIYKLKSYNSDESITLTNNTSDLVDSPESFDTVTDNMDSNEIPQTINNLFLV